MFFSSSKFETDEKPRNSNTLKSNKEKIKSQKRIQNPESWRTKSQKQQQSDPRKTKIKNSKNNQGGEEGAKARNPLDLSRARWRRWRLNQRLWRQCSPSKNRQLWILLPYLSVLLLDPSVLLPSRFLGCSIWVEGGVFLFSGGWIWIRI